MIGRIVAGLIGALAILAAVAILHEGISVGALGNRAGDYHFGTDTMIAKGGWAYRSPDHFLAASVVEGGPLFAGGLGILIALVARAKNRAVLASLCVVGAGVAAIAVRLLSLGA